MLSWCWPVCPLSWASPLCNPTTGTIIIPQLLAPNLWPASMWGDVVLSAVGLWFLPRWAEKGVSDACQRPPTAPGFLSRDHSMAFITSHWRTKMAPVPGFHPEVFIVITVWLKLKSFHNDCPLKGEAVEDRAQIYFYWYLWKTRRFFVQYQRMELFKGLIFPNVRGNIRRIGKVWPAIR